MIPERHRIIIAQVETLHRPSLSDEARREFKPVLQAALRLYDDKIRDDYSPMVARREDVEEFG